MSLAPPRSNDPPSWVETAFERLVEKIEDAPGNAQVRVPVRKHNLEAELLQGGRQAASCSSPHHGNGAHTPTNWHGTSANSKFVITDSPGTPQTASAAAMAQLQADLEQLLQQREQMRAQLIAEQDRRERAEAELVKVGAQWLGTETQQALRARAESERRRALDAERETIRREAEQRIAKAKAETALLRSQMSAGDTPTPLQLQLQLRAALKTELESERTVAREAVDQQLRKTAEERDALAAELRRAEASHRVELDALRASVRKASEMMQEQFDHGFVAGLKEAARALASGANDARSAGETKPATIPTTQAQPPPHDDAAKQREVCATTAAPCQRENTAPSSMGSAPSVCGARVAGTAPSPAPAPAPDPTAALIAVDGAAAKVKPSLDVEVSASASADVPRLDGEAAATHERIGAGIGDGSSHGVSVHADGAAEAAGGREPPPDHDDGNSGGEGAGVLGDDDEELSYSDDEDEANAPAAAHPLGSGNGHDGGPNVSDSSSRGAGHGALLQGLSVRHSRRSVNA